MRAYYPGPSAERSDHHVPMMCCPRNCELTPSPLFGPGIPDFAIRGFCFKEDCPEELGLIFADSIPQNGKFHATHAAVRNSPRPYILSTDFNIPLARRWVRGDEMLPKNMMLKQSPQGGLLRYPHSLPSLKAGVSRGES